MIKHPTTALEAAYQEALLEVLQLHTSIKKLPEELAPVLGAITQAVEMANKRVQAIDEESQKIHAEHAKKVVATYAGGIGKVVSEVVDRQMKVVIDQQLVRLSAAASEMNDAADNFKSAASSPMLSLRNSIFGIVMIGLVSGLAGGILVAYVTGNLF